MSRPISPNIQYAVQFPPHNLGNCREDRLSNTTFLAISYAIESRNCKSALRTCGVSAPKLPSHHSGDRKGGWTRILLFGVPLGRKRRSTSWNV